MRDFARGRGNIVLDIQFAAYLLPAALVFGAPSSLGTHEKGLFCESIELVERVAALSERGADPFRVVADINTRLTRNACIYSLAPTVRARTMKFEKNIAANQTTYSIYQVQVTAHPREMTEIGDIEWPYSQPLTMYVLREAAPAQTVAH